MTEYSQYATLEELLAADPLGTLSAKITEAHEAFERTHPEDAKHFQDFWERIGPRWREQRKNDPEFRALCETMDTPEGRRAIAAQLDIPAEDLERADSFGNEQREFVANAANLNTLQEEWEARKKTAGIKDVTLETFPAKLTRPMLVLYSADWCGPCRRKRPTFAQLVPFYRVADVRYCHDEALQDAHKIVGIPHFIAHFPNGTRIRSRVGDSTRGIWETMNNLVTLGRAYEGEGVYQCTDESCSIVPYTGQI